MSDVIEPTNQIEVPKVVQASILETRRICISAMSDASGHSSAGGGDTPWEKEDLIGQILELQNTLQDLSQRVNSVKEENAKLKTENEVRAHKLLPIVKPC